MSGPIGRAMDHDEQHSEGETTGASRRKFLGLAGAGAGAVAAGALLPGLAEAGRRDGDGDGDPRQRDGERGGRDGDGNRDRGGADSPERFIRMFDDLETFSRPSDELRASLTELGRPGGILDANDPLEVGPIRLITEPELSPNNPDNPTQTAGTTFVGQFLDHDITMDADSRLGRSTGLRRSINSRTARLDLDSVYGGGPADSPELYEADGRRLRVESGGQFEDLPRDADGVAIISDGRNDENLMIAGLQAAFLLFHNAVVDRVEASGLTGDAAFEEARRIVRWHWQWIVVHEFLPQIVGQSMVDSVFSGGRQFYTPRQPAIPVEFQTAAYRFGHSIVRPSYRANLAGDNGEPFFALIFDPAQFGQPDPDDLSGGSRAPRRFIGWQTFFDFGDREVRPNKRIDTKMSSPLFQLSAAAIGAPRGQDLGPTSLATRNLLRHITWDIPSGQAVARRMGVDPLASADLADFGQFGSALDTRTPLWLYVLREAELLEEGLHLGPVGGRIVAEVLIGLIELDESSYLNAPTTWSPTLPARDGGAGFGMADLLTVAGVDPSSRGQ